MKINTFSWQQRFNEWLERSRVYSDTVPLVIATVLGLLTGLSTYAFVWLVENISHLMTLLRDNLTVAAGVPVMMAAGLLVGWLIKRWAPETGGSGIPDVMEAVAIRRARIRPRVILFKLINSVLTIGVGGSAGREGPIVQIGAAWGSAEGQFLRRPDENVRVLVAAGSAAGIAAAFNAPIAGIMFALEVVVGQFNNRHLGKVVTAAVIANIVSRALLGENPAFAIPIHELHSVLELPLYVVLGLVCGVAAMGFISALYRTESLFTKYAPDLPKRAALGLGLVGLMTIAVPALLGYNLDFIGQVVTRHDDFTIQVLLGLFVLKFLATCLTLGSGTSGGIFAPVLFMGAMLGGVIGHAGNQLWPGTVIDTGAYAVVGMAAMLSAAVHAPISSIIIIVEMSNDYRLILPLLVAVTVATVLADIAQPDTIYTRKLTQRGIRLQQGQDIDLLQSVNVSEVMTKDYTEVHPTTTLAEVAKMFTMTRNHGFPIVNEQGHLYGVVTLSDVEQAQAEGYDLESRVTKFGTTANLLTVFPDDPIYTALQLMNRHDIGRLPVVSHYDEALFVGMVGRAAILRAYEIGARRKAAERHRLEHFKLRDFEPNAFIEVEVVPDAPMAGRQLSEFPYSADCLLVSVRRAGHTFIAHGSTRIQTKDLLTAYCSAEMRQQVREQFAMVAPPPEPSVEGNGASGDEDVAEKAEMESRSK
jgi:CIC family chloride channel protein